MIVTFDFDGTFWRWAFDPDDGIFSRSGGPDPNALDIINLLKQEGASVHIVTSRGSSTRNEVESLLTEHRHLFDGIHFTEGAWKSKKLAELGSAIHHDDDPEEILRLEPRTRGVLWKTGHLDENLNVCDPDLPRFHFSNWE